MKFLHKMQKKQTGVDPSKTQLFVVTHRKKNKQTGEHDGEWIETRAENAYVSFLLFSISTSIYVIILRIIKNYIMWNFVCRELSTISERNKYVLSQIRLTPHSVVMMNYCLKQLVGCTRAEHMDKVLCQRDRDPYMLLHRPRVLYRTKITRRWRVM